MAGFRISVTHRGRTDFREIRSDEIVIGRPKDGIAPDLDLDPDKNVSRRHARIWREAGQVWMEESGSRGGTRETTIDFMGGPAHIYAYSPPLPIDQTLKLPQSR